MNETLRTVEGRSVLRIERHLAHPPAKVWRVGLSSVWCAVGVSGRNGGTLVGERLRGRRSKRRSLFRLRRGDGPLRSF